MRNMLFPRVVFPRFSRSISMRAMTGAVLGIYAIAFFGEVFRQALA